MNLFRLFAAEDEPHISLEAEELFRAGDFIITNSMVYGTLLILILIIVAWRIGSRARVKPQRGIVNMFELILEHLLKMLEGVFKDRKLAYRFLPIFSVYFIYIMFSNISGLLPWVGNGVTGGPDAIPAFRPFTADINGVLAMAIFSIAAVQVLSVREQGIKAHLQHYFSDKPKNPINIFVGLLEVLGEATRVLSLTLRLFLNTVIGEILVTVFIFMSGPATPLTLVPIILFELLVAYIQAYVFTILSATYLGMAIAHHGEHHDEEHTDSHSSHEADADESNPTNKSNQPAQATA